MVGTAGVVCRVRYGGLLTSVTGVLAVHSGIRAGHSGTRAGHSGTRRKLRLVRKTLNVSNEIKWVLTSQGTIHIPLHLNKLLK